MALAQEAPAEEEEPLHASWYLIPNAAYDTDDGLGGGARFEWAKVGGGYEPYKLSVVVQSYVAWSGFQHHRLRIDRTGLGPRRRLRATLHVAWRQWLHDGYWGIGNGTTREEAYVGDFERKDPRGDRYHYRLYQPFAHLSLRQHLGEGPWSAFVAINPKYSTIEAYSGSLLEAQQPYGMGGGLAVQLMAGALYDTRAPEIAPREGVLLEASARATPDLGGEAGGFWGLLGSARAFVAAGGRVVFAGRLMAEWLHGTVPFYEQVHWGGYVPIAGFGSAETVRGMSFGRWRAPGKAVANFETRIDLFTHKVAKRPLTWELAPYLDVGTVFDAGDDATAPAPAQPLHPAAGLGLRFRFDQTFVGRIDAGYGLDPVEGAAGIRQEPSLGLYLVFDHPF